MAGNSRGESPCNPALASLVFGFHRFDSVLHNRLLSSDAAPLPGPSTQQAHADQAGRHDKAERAARPQGQAGGGTEAADAQAEGDALVALLEGLFAFLGFLFHDYIITI